MRFLFDRVPPLGLAVLGFCFLVSMVVGSLAGVFTVFVLPVGASLGLDRGEIASVYSTALLVSGLASPLIGGLFDRFGPFWIYLSGLALCVAGYALASQAQGLIEIGLFYGGLTGLGGALAGGVSHSALIARWFREKSGTAVGLVFSAGGLAMVGVSPLTQVLIDLHGWRATLLGFAGVVALLVPLVLAMPWRRIMAAEGASKAIADAPELKPPDDPGFWQMRTAVRTWSFWGLFAVYFFTGGATTSWYVHMVGYLVDAGYAPLAAAAAFGAIGLVTPIGMIGFGYLGDRIGRSRAALLSYGLTGTSFLCFGLIASGPSPWLLWLGVICFGLSAGSRGPLVSAISMDLFAGPRLGGIYGGVSLGGGIGAALATWAGGELMDLTGDPLSFVWFTSVLLVIGGAPFWAIRPIARN